MRTVFAELALLAFVALPGCAPAVILGCSVDKDAAGNVIAKLTLQNRSSKRIIKVNALVDVKSADPRGGNRIFEMTANVPAGETRTLEGLSIDPRNTWLFKRNSDATKGCELDTVFFEDGWNWQLGVPFI